MDLRELERLIDHPALYAALTGGQPSGASNGWSSYRCPLHPDKTASLRVKLDCGAWACHSGCGKGSGAVSIASKVWGLTQPAQLPEVKSRLMREYGRSGAAPALAVVLPTPAPGAPAMEEESTGDLAASWVALIDLGVYDAAIEARDKGTIKTSVAVAAIRIDTMARWGSRSDNATYSHATVRAALRIEPALYSRAINWLSSVGVSRDEYSWNPRMPSSTDPNAVRDLFLPIPVAAIFCLFPSRAGGRLQRTPGDLLTLIDLHRCAEASTAAQPPARDKRKRLIPRDWTFALPDAAIASFLKCNRVSLARVLSRLDRLGFWDRNARRLTPSVARERCHGRESPLGWLRAGSDRQLDRLWATHLDQADTAPASPTISPIGYEPPYLVAVRNDEPPIFIDDDVAAPMLASGSRYVVV